VSFCINPPKIGFIEREIRGIYSNDMQILLSRNEKRGKISIANILKTVGL